MIGNYILSGRVQAVVSTTLSILISFVLPPLAYLLSGSVIALITLRKGAAIGIQTIIGSMFVLLVFSGLAGLPLQLSLAYALVILVPVWFASSSLRLTESQGVFLLMTGILAMSLIIAIYVVIDDVAIWWQKWFEVMLEQAVPHEQVVQYMEVLKPAALLINAMMVVGLMLNIFMSVMCARWWQSKLFNPGAFRKEFFDLQLPSFILPATAVLFGLVLLLSDPWQGMFRDILILLMFMYLIQGLSSVHRNVDKYKLSMAWLVSMYGLLILLPQMGLFIACLGMTDIYVNWRREKIRAGIKS